VDPAKRLSAAEVLRHRWLAVGGASVAPLASAAEQLRKYQAKRRFKNGVRKVMAAQMFARLGAMKLGSDEGEDAGASPSEAAAGVTPPAAAAAAAAGGAGAAASPGAVAAAKPARA
jgi:hypothetical protein